MLATLQASCSAFPLSQAELTRQASFVSEYHAQGSVGMELGIETGLQQGRARPKPGSGRPGSAEAKTAGQSGVPGNPQSSPVCSAGRGSEAQLRV